MYDDYIDHCKANDENSVSYVSYYRMVVANNISFAHLGDEECEVCETHPMLLLQELEGNRESDQSQSRKIVSHRNLQESSLTCGAESCDLCKQWLQHQTKFMEARKVYLEDKLKQQAIDGTGEIYLSADMQKVILLTRIPGFKINLFTKRMVRINQTFTPLNKLDVDKKRALGVYGTKGLQDKMMRM